MTRNTILSADSYKASHWLQYPPGTSGMFSYIEARKGTPFGSEVLFFGLQAILRQYLRPVTRWHVQEAAHVFAKHGVPFNKAGWLYIAEELGGKLPVRINAVPEGTLVPVGNILASIESTDPNVPWVASYLETLLLRVWYPCTVATRSFEAKKVIADHMAKSSDNFDGLPFKLHDFGARGVSSGESAALGGLAHLVNFMGTDTIEALLAAWDSYDHSDELAAGYSIPAAEHSTITSWGKEHEVDAYRNMLRQYGKPGAVLAVVSDSYDIRHACDQLWGVELRQDVIDSGATVVIRPDSGDPVTTVNDVAHILANRFGYTLNSKGFKVLNNVRIIQGDGLDHPGVIGAILGMLEMSGFSADNIAFGMGGGLLQKLDRDTLGFAMKCSAIRVNGEWRDVFKEAPGKKSKKGRIELRDTSLGLVTVNESSPVSEFSKPVMQTVFLDGELMNSTTLDDVRQRAAAAIPQLTA